MPSKRKKKLLISPRVCSPQQGQKQEPILRREIPTEQNPSSAVPPARLPGFGVGGGRSPKLLLPSINTDCLSGFLTPSRKRFCSTRIP